MSDDLLVHYTISRDHTSQAFEQDDLSLLIQGAETVSGPELPEPVSPTPDLDDELLSLAGGNPSPDQGQSPDSGSAALDSASPRDIPQADAVRRISSPLTINRDGARAPSPGRETQRRRRNRRVESVSTQNTPDSKAYTMFQPMSDHDDILNRFQATASSASKRPLDSIGSNDTTMPRKRLLVYEHPDSDQSNAQSSLDEGADNPSYDDIERRILDLKTEIKSLEGWRKRQVPVTWRVIHRVHRGIREGSRAGVDCYLDQPRWYGGIEGHQPLAGTEPILDVKSYIDRHPEFAFVVFRDYGSPRLDGGHFAAMNQTNHQPVEEGYPLPSSESIKFVYEDLHNAVESFLHGLPNNNGIPYPLDKQWPAELQAPYLCIYHYRDKFATMHDLLPDRLRKPWNMFNDYVQSGFNLEYCEADRQFQQGLVCPRFLKYLIMAGDVLYSPNHAVVRAVQALTPLQDPHQLQDKYYLPKGAEIENELGDEEHSDLQKPSGRQPQIAWSFEVMHWSFNVMFKRQTHKVHLDMRASIDLAVPIVTLQLYPIQYADATIQQMIYQCGMSFWKCRNRRYVEYSKDTGEHAWSNTKSRYMVDPMTYVRMHKTTGTENFPPASDDLPVDVFAREACPEYPFPMLLPTKVQGYNFIEKKWVDLEVQHVSDVEWNTKAFENLVTEEETKDLLEALVKNQLKVESSTDLIAGKGNGLIILLHGGPGTGKTYTAESVADYARKPLYRVTCGDIGTGPVEVEKYLETVLRLGRIWGCVVLLDEADIFLEERTLADLERNALVSVFLRILEYYNGILILTSNRVGHFDEAFKSRIQLALHYDSLNREQRHQIWTNFIKHLHASGSCQMDFDDLVLHIHDLSQYELNGRQIRNSITTARQLAEFRKKDLNYDIITKVIRVAGKFDSYLRSVKKADIIKGGTADEQIARDAGMR